MLGGLLTMSANEVDRLGVIRRVLEGGLPQKQAALMMGLTRRQARRLCAAFEVERRWAGVEEPRKGAPSQPSQGGALDHRYISCG
jgi:hypothetical protein